MAIGHTRRLCARFSNEATGKQIHKNEISHATRLELASIETWIHEEGLQASNNLDPGNIVVEVREVKHSDVNIQQQPSDGAAEQAMNETEASNDKAQTEETDLPNLIGKWYAAIKTKSPAKRAAIGPFPKAQKSHRIWVSLHQKPYKKAH